MSVIHDNIRKQCYDKFMPVMKIVLATDIVVTLHDVEFFNALPGCVDIRFVKNMSKQDTIVIELLDYNNEVTDEIECNPENCLGLDSKYVITLHDTSKATKHEEAKENLDKPVEEQQTDSFHEVHQSAERDFTGEALRKKLGFEKGQEIETFLK